MCFSCRPQVNPPGNYAIWQDLLNRKQTIKIGLQVTRVNSCGVFDRSRQWSEQELSVSWSSISKDTAAEVMMRGDLGLVHVWSIGAWIEFKDSPTQKLYGFGCYGVSNLGIYNFGVSRDTHFISVYKLATNVTSHTAPEMCHPNWTAVEEWLAPYINNIFTILAIWTVLLYYIGHVNHMLPAIH